MPGGFLLEFRVVINLFSNGSGLEAMTRVKVHSQWLCLVWARTISPFAEFILHMNTSEQLIPAMATKQRESDTDWASTVYFMSDGAIADSKNGLLTLISTVPHW